MLSCSAENESRRSSGNVHRLKGTSKPSKLAVDSFVSERACKGKLVYSRIRRRSRPSAHECHDPVALARLWCVREHLHSRKQLALCDEVERASMLLWDLRSGVHRLDFAADTEQGEGRIKAAAMLRRRADALRARIKSLHRERGAMLRALDQGDAAHEHRQSELLRAVFAGRKPS